MGHAYSSLINLLFIVGPALWLFTIGHKKLERWGKIKDPGCVVWLVGMLWMWWASVYVDSI